MCGIGGVLAVRGERVLRSHAQMFSSLLEHRGPDDLGFLSLLDGHVCADRDVQRLPEAADLYLIHRRLAILDLSPTGWQPMSVGEGQYWIIFNGEIYNYVELRRELESIGHRFRSRSDTEVLLTAYAEWGQRAFAKLIGMFAVAILDARSRELILVRDFFGIKPLYYCRSNVGFAFGSELKPLLKLPGVSRAIDPEPLYYYIRFGIIEQDERTLFTAIRQVPPAHVMRVSLDDLSVKSARFWSLSNEREDLSFDEAARELRRLFTESVMLHLRSDVPVGTALSGGIDSSAIIMAMRSLVGEKLQIHAFTYVSGDVSTNEEKWADLAGQHSRALVHKVQLTPEDLVRDLPDVIKAQDLPFNSTSIYAQYRVFQLAKDAGIKVMLDGQGADELLGGYRSFLSARLSSLLRQFRIGKAARFFRAASRLPDVTGAFLIQSTGELLLPRVLRRPLRTAVGKDLFPRWLRREWFRNHGLEEESPVSGDRQRTLRSALRRAVDYGTLPSLLRYEDRNSMAFSIESRVPFLTPDLASFILSLPEEYLISDCAETKSVFRAAMRGIVPDAILDRRDKIAFATPERDWLVRLAPWIDLTLRDADAVTALDGPALRQEIAGILSGGRPFHYGVWRALNLIAWRQATGAEF